MEKRYSLLIIVLLAIIVVLVVSMGVILFQNKSSTTGQVIGDELIENSQTCYKKQLEFEKTYCNGDFGPGGGSWIYTARCTLTNKENIGGDFILRFRVYDTSNYEISEWSKEVAVFLDPFETKTIQEQLGAGIRGVDIAPEVSNLEVDVIAPIKEFCE